MTSLRAAKISDELGSGKTRIFRQMIESGKKEPTIEFSTKNNYGAWETTLYNNHLDEHLNDLIKKFYESYSIMNQARIATALVLWADHGWSSISDRLDEYYKKVALEVIQSPYSPVIVVEDELLLKKWVNVALKGQSSQSFTPAEEKKMESILRAYSFRDDKGGYITTDQAKGIIGLSNSRSETTQLSNLLRKWRDEGIVEHIKKGHWKFLSDKDLKSILISSIFQDIAENLNESNITLGNSLYTSKENDD